MVYRVYNILHVNMPFSFLLQIDPIVDGYPRRHILYPTFTLYTTIYALYSISVLSILFHTSSFLWPLFLLLCLLYAFTFLSPFFDLPIHPIHCTLYAGALHSSPYPSVCVSVCLHYTHSILHSLILFLSRIFSTLSLLSTSPSINHHQSYTTTPYTLQYSPFILIYISFLISIF